MFLDLLDINCGYFQVVISNHVTALDNFAIENILPSIMVSIFCFGLLTDQFHLNNFSLYISIYLFNQFTLFCSSIFFFLANSTQISGILFDVDCIFVFLLKRRFLFLIFRAQK